ncbi:hypothetical protein POSPLADRAFT_1043302 [Postia placenta MAD-698-R-SB12]|uniref:Uncharacterized protein n=1 Tax=Postia placenta MAD-698-R-SB12 TaxID=670580 RepID=A0A1X6NHT8_9APHY|nr:hypothetical protein POSPLADRAFT_1043302 [Postia placenta MAD-698-R-SB12]OSX68174.1 hypothetical protein POSPLADRAFT_1043302 [Postia placenta MAD-698-R-SB12]
MPVSSSALANWDGSLSSPARRSAQSSHFPSSPALPAPPIAPLLRVAHKPASTASSSSELALAMPPPSSSLFFSRHRSETSSSEEKDRLAVAVMLSANDSDEASPTDDARDSANANVDHSHKPNAKETSAAFTALGMPTTLPLFLPSDSPGLDDLPDLQYPDEEDIGDPDLQTTEVPAEVIVTTVGIDLEATIETLLLNMPATAPGAHTVRADATADSFPGEEAQTPEPEMHLMDVDDEGATENAATIESDLYHARDHMSSAAIAEESENSDFDFIVDRVTEEVSRSLARQEKRNAPMHRQQLQGLMRQHHMTGSSITYRSHVPLAVTIAAERVSKLKLKDTTAITDSGYLHLPFSPVSGPLFIAHPATLFLPQTSEAICRSACAHARRFKGVTGKTAGRGALVASAYRDAGLGDGRGR